MFMLMGAASTLAAAAGVANGIASGNAEKLKQEFFYNAVYHPEKLPVPKEDLKYLKFEGNHLYDTRTWKKIF